MNQKPPECRFLYAARNFAETHAIDSEITPVDLGDLNQVGVAEKSGKYPNTVRRVVCDNGACSGAIVMRLEHDELVENIGLTGQCSVKAAAERAAEEALKRELLKPQN